MPCTVVNSQSQVQSRLPTLPQSIPKTQQDWNALLAILNQWGSILQQASHAPNVIPSQFQTFTPTAAAAVIAALSAASCTPSIDNTNQYYGGASLRAVISATGATLQFSGFPISIAPATRWFCSFQILAPSGCTASLTVSTSAGHSITESFTVPASASWQQVWGLFDLRPYADTQATWKFTFTSTATVNIDGMQMNAVGSPIGVLPKFAGTQMVTGALAYASNLDSVPDGSTYERMPGSNMDANRRGLIDFTQAGHLSKNLDNVGDGSTYARALAAYLSAGRPYNLQGAWNSATTYHKGDEVTSGGNYYLALATSTNVAPPNVTFWQLLGPVTLDNLSDGSTYGRHLGSGLTGGITNTAGLVANAVTEVDSNFNSTSSAMGANRAYATVNVTVPVGAAYVALVVGNALVSLGSAPTGAFNLSLDGSTVQGPNGWNSAMANLNYSTSFAYTTTLAAGAHTFEIDGFNSSGGATFQSAGLTVVLLKR